MCGRQVVLCFDGFYQGVFAAVAYDEIDPREGSNGFGVELGVTAGDDEEGTGMTTVGLADQLARTAVAQVGDGAGVDDIDVSDLIEVALGKASIAHLLTNGFTIGLVYLAAEGGDCKCCFF